jgi:hypothetical protein
MDSWKGFGSKRPWANRRTVLEFASKDEGKITKTSAKMAGGLAEI